MNFCKAVLVFTAAFALAACGHKASPHIHRAPHATLESLTMGRQSYLTVTRFQAFRKVPVDHYYHKVVWYDVRENEWSSYCAPVVWNGPDGSDQQAEQAERAQVQECNARMQWDAAHAGHGSTVAAAFADWAKKNP